MAAKAAIGLTSSPNLNCPNIHNRLKRLVGWERALNLDFTRKAIFALALALSSSLPAEAAPGADVYGAQPEFEGIRISPNGQRIAHITTRNDQHVAIIRDLATDTSCGFSTDKLKIRELIWAPQDRLLIRLSPNNGGFNRHISIDVRCKDPKLLFDKNAGAEAALIGWAPDGKRLLWSSFRIMPGSRIATYDPYYKWKGFRTKIDVAMDVIAVDPATGGIELVEKGNENTVAWLTDAAGNLRLRIDESRDRVLSVFSRPVSGTGWEKVYASSSNGDGTRKYPISFDAMGPKPDTVYVMTYNGGDKLGAYEFDLRTRSIGPSVFLNANYDAEGFQRDEYSGQVLGVRYVDDVSRVNYIDPAVALIVTRLRALLPGDQVNIESMARNRTSYILRADGPSNPTGTYYLADIVTGEVSRIGPRYPTLSKADIATVRSYPYVARDGLKIPGYLTLPPQSPGGKLPLVVMPHGGPELRDSTNFDNWVQFLATRGYAVFQPQFRGSDGYGWAFKQAGRLQWGLKMQDDITDGVRKLVNEGTVDPSRICIFGWSYGGYATLAGLAFTPDLYKCGVSGAGVSDLREMFAHLKEQGGGWAGVDYWPDVIGDPFRDAQRLEATSPVNHANAFKAPVLLLHGKNDWIVPWRQSENMARALSKAGKPHEFVTLEGDDHWISRAANEKRVLIELERFLNQHLK